MVYEVRFCLSKKSDHYGFCEKHKRLIQIQKGLSDKLEMDTLIHEALHACDWSKSEQNVNQTATDIANMLYQRSYRRKI